MTLNTTCPALPTLLHRLPPELRFEIFALAFTPESAREVITITTCSSSSSFSTNAIPRLDLQFKDQHKTKHAQQFERRKLWLQPHLVGADLALEAAEALYSSKAMFAVHAEDLPVFLSRCPLSGLSNPGRFISRLHLYANEDPTFNGNNEDHDHGHGHAHGHGYHVQQYRHALRLADWVDHSSLTTNGRRSTRKPCTSLSSHTTQMRTAWRLILLMPSLANFELRLLPHQGRLPLSHLTHLEIRDILPSLFRLFMKGVAVQLYVRTWTSISRASPLPLHKLADTQNPNTFEEAVVLDAFLPFGVQGVRVPELAKKEIGKIVAKDDTRIPLGCLLPARDVAEARRWAVRGETQATCRKALYFALEGLFTRLIESGEYEFVHNDIIRIPSLLSTTKSLPQNSFSQSTTHMPLQLCRNELMNLNQIHHLPSAALPTPPNTPPLLPHTILTPISTTSLYNTHITPAPPPSPLFSFPAVAKMLQEKHGSDASAGKHQHDATMAWKGRILWGKGK